MKLSNLTFVSLFVAACGGGGGEGDATSEVTGAATYRDAATDKQGNAQEPAAPPSQGAKIFVTIEGEGTLPQVDPQCALDPAGQFEARYTGTANLSDDAAYAALFGESSGSIVTPSGCVIPELTVGLITDIRVRGELTVNSQNCQSYCSAAARAEAEQSCGATSSAAQCRTDAEAAGEASCMTSCTTQTHVIVAETSVGASTFGELDAEALRAAAFGDFRADLVFDHMEDEDGAVIEF